MADFAYDLEVFPNFFSASFIDIQTEEVFQFIVAEHRDDRKELAEFINKAHKLIGFNSLSYDDAVLVVFLRAIKQKNLNSVLFALSGRLIAEGSFWDDQIREVRYSKRSWKSIDLLKIMAFDKKGISLKQIAIILGWPLIQDLPLPYDENVDLFDYGMVLEYNLNDVGITLKLYREIEKERKLREEINQIYHVDVSNASRSKMGNVLLEKFYVEATNINIKQLRDLRTNRLKIKLDDCIPSNVQLGHTVLSDLVNDLRGIIVNEDTKFKYEKKVWFVDKEYQLGVGGLHSVDDPAKFVADEDHYLIDVDVASFYPSMMLNLQIKPEHLGHEFLDILDMIRKERLEAKHQGNKTKAEALKITINAIFGKLGTDKFWLYDPKAMLQVTIAGQLYLLMLIERFADAGVEILSANTDGVLCRVPKERLDRFNHECETWQGELGYELEQTQYQKVIRRDVNNYIALKLDGTVKMKGIFDTELNLEKMYNYPIVARALKNYFIDGISPEETVATSQNILDFQISQKTGPAFQSEYHTRKGIELLQKTNRFYASNLGGIIVKRNRTTDKVIGLLVGQNTRILNQYDPKLPITSYDVDYDFYLKRIYETIDALEPRYIQLSFV